MSDTCPTVRITPEHESQGAFVEINESDFDPAVHTLYEEPGVVITLASRTVKQLKAIAAERGVDLGDATEKGDIIAAIELHAELAPVDPPQA